jgi:hypothetical protein
VPRLGSPPVSVVLAITFLLVGLAVSIPAAIRPALTLAIMSAAATWVLTENLGAMTSGSRSLRPSSLKRSRDSPSRDTFSRSSPAGGQRPGEPGEPDAAGGQRDLGPRVQRSRAGPLGRGPARYLSDYVHWACLGALCEFPPLPGNRVTLDTEQDRHGLPVARVSYSQCDNDRQLMRAAQDVVDQLATHAG